LSYGRSSVFRNPIFVSPASGGILKSVLILASPDSVGIAKINRFGKGRCSIRLSYGRKKNITIKPFAHPDALPHPLAIGILKMATAHFVRRPFWKLRAQNPDPKYNNII